MNNNEGLSNDQEIIKFNTIGKSNIKTYSFPNEWFLDIYNNNLTLKNEDIENQKKYEELEYFKDLKGVKDESTKPYFTYFKNKNDLLKNSIIDSLFIVDSIIIKNNRKILTFKTFATLDDNNYEFPLKIYNIDIVLFDGINTIQSENIYSEIVYPYYVKQNICYLDGEGNLYCKKFVIDEEKIYYKGFYEKELRKIFNLN
ncbi:hypothetical protein [Chishuiella sp.]|uniref:hypothetical protein n=1 Tax=Chishuiella sp. TaxID=1969467 RepID=UPI0028A9E74D|nr:hypothetical protein [Chishuiella sp.]